MWIYGASGHGKVILDCLLANGEKVNGFIDDNPDKKEFMHLPVLSIDKINLKRDKIVLGIGDNNIRKVLADKLKAHFKSVIHPSAVVSPESIVGVGSVVIPQSVINTGTQIGKHCIINTKASVDHDCRIGDYVHIAPGAIICGNVTIGSLTWIGAGAVIRENVKIGKNVMIGAGSVVVNDIPDSAFVLGIPGKIIKFKNEITGKEKSDVYIIGASGFGREIETWISQSKSFNEKYSLKGFLDDNLSALKGYPSDYTIIDKIDNFPFRKGDFVLLGISNPIIKENIINRLIGKVKYLSFISNNAIIGKNVQIGEGTIVAPNCIISTNITIGRFVTINLGTQIGHDSTISDYSSIMAHVDLSGKTRVGKGVFIGSNSTIYPGMEIGENSKISAGSIVLNDIKENSLVFGNPARSTTIKYEQ